MNGNREIVGIYRSYSNPLNCFLGNFGSKLLFLASYYEGK